MLTTTPCLTPALHFNSYITVWEKQKIEKLASLLTSHSLSKADISSDGQQECILYGHLYTDYGMITDKVVHKTNAHITNPVYSKFGDVLIPASDTTPTGLARATSIEKSDVLLGGDINIIRPNDDVNGSCLSLSLNANRKKLIRLIRGTTVKHIHNSEIKNIELMLPQSKEEQTKIAALFKQYAIFHSHETIKNLKLWKLRTRLFQTLFPQDGVACPRIRFKGFSTCWEEQEFGKLYGKTCVRNKHSYDSSQVISPIDMCYKTSISQQQEKILPEYQVWNVGDIAFAGGTSSVYPFGRFVENTLGVGIIPERLNVFKPLMSYDLQFWKYYIQNERIMTSLLGRVTNATMIFTGLITTDFLRESIRVPSWGEQTRIGVLLSRFDDLLDCRERFVEKLHRLEGVLLRGMFPRD